MTKYPFLITRYFSGHIQRSPQTHACETLVEAVSRANEYSKLSQTRRIIVSVVLWDTGELHHEIKR